MPLLFFVFTLHHTKPLKKNFFKKSIDNTKNSAILYLTTPGRGYGGERIPKNFS